MLFQKLVYILMDHLILKLDELTKDLNFKF
jgi:hypothetical protein